MTEAVPAAVFFIAGWAASRLILPGMLEIISGAGFTRSNYMGKEIPCGAGVVIFFSSLAVLTVSLLFSWPAEIRLNTLVFLLGLSGFTLLGLVDDVWGSGHCRGIPGHMRSLLRGRLTTGSIKALAGGLLALLIAAACGPREQIPLNALVIALSVNMLNLLDLRPGRAGKSFLAVGILIAAAFPLKIEIVFMAAVAGSLLAYLPYDLGARAMLGDTGANALGSVLGVTAAWLFDPGTRLAYLAVLVVLHIVAEKYSFTRIIASNRVLDYLDRMGRGKDGNED